MLTILCVSSYEKGHDFIRQAKEQGCRVLLLTSQSLENANWPRNSIDEIYYIPDKNKDWNMKDVIYGVSYLARTEIIDRIVALDDFDVERVASLREHLRIGGMGDTTARYFRDKLAMRVRAKELNIPVPEFQHILNYNKINDFIKTVSFPYMVKPRLLAGSYGLKKVHNENELWDRINFLGDEQSFFLIEKFIPGSIYHVDTIVYNYDVKFSCVSKYGTPPFEVAHHGRVFTSKTLDNDDPSYSMLTEMNKKLLKGLGLKLGISHSEYILSEEDGKFYFLETSARVCGANLSVLIEAATGINLWREWAKIEILNGEQSYDVIPSRRNYAGIITSLAKQQYPDLSNFNEPEVFWKLKKEYHAGIVISSPDKNKRDELLDNYTKKFYEQFFATAQMGEKPTD